ncbi:MAG: phosphate-selective porin family protein [Phycisphaerales bacterium]|nr:phosphate-selective porin family protein [Phycisphaerales bacterium]
MRANYKDALLFLICSFVICRGTGTRAWAGEKDAAATTQQELLDEVRALRAEVKELRAKVAESQPATQPASLPRTAPSPAGADSQETIDQLRRDADRRSTFADVEGLTAGYRRNTGFFIGSEDGNFLLHPWAFVQVRNATNYRERATATEGDTQNGFELPRMKFILDGNIFSPDLTFQFIWATSDTTGNLGLQDAWGRYHLPNTPFALRAGQIRDPVDHEQIIYATRSLTPGRSIVNNVLLNGDDIVKGASISYGFDGNNPFRTEIAITSGERNFDTTFQQFPTNTADWGTAGRFEFKLMGDWSDYTQFTALGNKQPLLVLGAGFDYTGAGDTGQFTHVADIQYTLPNNLSLYGAYLGRYVSHNGGNPLTNGGFTGPGPSANTYDASFRLLASYLIEDHWEPFARFEWIEFDSRELSAGTQHVVYDLTLGFNYYFYGHRAKFSGAATYLPNGSPISSTIDDVLSSHGGNEVIIQAQFQLIF